MNERDYPHIVELAVPSGGFRSKSDEMVAFHRELGVEARRGRGRTDDAGYLSIESIDAAEYATPRSLR
jgi:hypothetical protein